MSAIVCGKRSLFEDFPSTTVSSKRIRCYSSTSPIRSSPPRSSSISFPFSPHSSSSSPFYLSSVSEIDLISSTVVSGPLLDCLIAIFPDMDKQLLERALEECGNDLDSAIKSLYELRLGSVELFDASVVANAQLQPQVVVSTVDVASSGDKSVPNNLPKDGSDWVELFVREMMSASNMDDARARASRVLEVLEKSIFSRVGAEAALNCHKENTILKEQVEILTRENTILKRAVAIQHERQKEFDDRDQEVQHLKQLVSQYQEQLRTLEVNNYALMMHLRRSQQNGSIPGRFHPDVF